MEPVLAKGMGFLFFAHATNALRHALHALRLRVNAMFTCSKPWRRGALPVLRSPARRDAGGCSMLLYGHATRTRSRFQWGTSEQLKGEGGMRFLKGKISVRN